MTEPTNINQHGACAKRDEQVWGYSPYKNGDESGWSGECATREDAIADGRREFDGERDRFWIVRGEWQPHHIFMADADKILDDANWRAVELVGDLGEKMHQVDEDAIQELDELLQSWAAKRLIRYWKPNGEPEEISMLPLRFFHDGVNTVIAHDVEDAKVVYEKHTVDVWYPERGDGMGWLAGSAWDSTEPRGVVSCLFADMSDVPAYAAGHCDPYVRPNGNIRVAMTAAEWIAGHGRGYFGSTEGP